MDSLLLKALGAAYRKFHPIDPVLTPRMQVLLLRLAAHEAKAAHGLSCSGRRARATS